MDRRFLYGTVCAAFFPLAGIWGAATLYAQTRPDVGFISALKGRPQIRMATGKVVPATLMQPLAPGVSIVLSVNESFGFCHESASRTFRIEGEGVVHVGDVGINTTPGGPRVTALGPCTTSSTPSETGGILSRGFKPPSSPK